MYLTHIYKVTVSIDNMSVLELSYEWGAFLITEQEGYCTAHLINEGVSVKGNKVTLEFTLSGDAERASCILNPPATKENQFFPC